ncbi:MAG: hypothetical protein OHK0036_15530 [Bacteroidia bacterium]
MKFIDEIDSLGKIGVSENDEFESILSFMYEFSTRVTDFLNIERINIWLLNKEMNAIFSIAEYDKRYNQFQHHSWIYEKDIPHYFQHLKEDKIILAPEISKHPATYELTDNYAKEHNVISLMDIPLRLNGVLIGVMCFEKTGNEPRVFNEMEQTFAVAISHLAVAHIENVKRRSIQKKLENALKEKEVLIKELNHRVKNNFSVLVSLLRLSKENVIQEKNDRFETFEHQVFSMMKVHELLMESENYQSINLSQYLHKLCSEFIASYPELKNQLHFNIQECEFNILPKHSVHLGLIITEIFLNALKYCVLEHSGKFELEFRMLSNEKTEIIAGDSCHQFDFEKCFQNHHSLGLSIIKDLADSSGFEMDYPVVGNSTYRIIIHRNSQ